MISFGDIFLHPYNRQRTLYTFWQFAYYRTLRKSNMYVVQAIKLKETIEIKET